MADTTMGGTPLGTLTVIGKYRVDTVAYSQFAADNFTHTTAEGPRFCCSCGGRCTLAVAAAAAAFATIGLPSISTGY